jgi:hypothetical protein
VKRASTSAASSLIDKRKSGREIRTYSGLSAESVDECGRTRQVYVVKKEPSLDLLFQADCDGVSILTQ